MTWGLDLSRVGVTRTRHVQWRSALLVAAGPEDAKPDGDTLTKPGLPAEPRSRIGVLALALGAAGRL